MLLCTIAMSVALCVTPYQFQEAAGTISNNTACSCFWPIKNQTTPKSLGWWRTNSASKHLLFPCKLGTAWWETEKRKHISKLLFTFWFQINQDMVCVAVFVVCLTSFYGSFRHPAPFALSDAPNLLTGFKLCLFLCPSARWPACIVSVLGPETDWSTPSQAS